ncbi:hypothetical protein COCNU_contig68531939G000010 [Cocos nucifera]|nr:hypothetical protein [Cocos nucifera]
MRMVQHHLPAVSTPSNASIRGNDLDSGEAATGSPEVRVVRGEALDHHSGIRNRIRESL